MTKRRAISLSDESDEFLRRTTPNISRLVDEAVLALIEAEEKGEVDDVHEKSADIRMLILRMQREVLAKEIHELKRQLGAIDKAMERAEENPQAPWKVRLDRLKNYDQNTGLVQERGGDE